MNYSLRKISLSVFVLFILFGFYWYMKNMGYINTITHGKILLNLNDSTQGYSSIRAYTLNYSFFFLLLMKIHNQFEKPHIIIRNKSRKSLFNSRVQSILFSAFLFSFAYSTVNLVLTAYYFGPGFLLKNDFIIITMLNCIILIFFYWWIGLLEQALEDKGIPMNIAMVSTFIFVALLYFLRRGTIWIPINDLSIYDLMIKGLWGYKDLLLAYVRQLGLGIVVLIIGYTFFKEKDFVLYEK